MRKLLFIILLLPLVVHSQQIDTIIFRFSNGDIKYLVARGGTGVGTDSIWVNHNGVRTLISPLDLPINNATQTALDTKQATLVSATNIKTVNGSSLLGSGDIPISGTAAWGSVTGTLADQTDLQNALNLKGNITSQTFVTPNIGAATATSINGNIFTTGTYTLTGVAGKTLTFNKSITLEGTDAQTYTFPTTSATIARTDAANTFTGIQTMTSPAITTPTGIVKGDVGLGNVENTALSTWAGTANVTTVGTIGTGTWNATAIADGKIASALTGKTYNGLTITSSTGTLTIANGKTATINNSVTIAGTDGVTTTLPAVAGTVMLNTSTSGVAASPTASSTTTVTHNLGRVPTIIRIYSISSFTSNAAATPVPFSNGTFNSTGNRCVYMVINGTTTQVSQTSTVFSVIMVTSAGNQITGVIGNLTSTGFDIVWTETGTHTAGNYLWEAQ